MNVAFGGRSVLAAATAMLAGAATSLAAQADPAPGRAVHFLSRQGPPAAQLLPAAASVTLDGTLSDKTAKARYGLRSDDLTLGFALEGPIDKASPSSVLADLDGLRGATTLTIDLDLTVWNPQFDLSALTPAVWGSIRRGVLAEGFADPGEAASLQRLPPGKWRDALLLHAKIGTPVFLGGRLTFGRQGFEYVDTTSLSDRKTTEDVIGFRLVAGVLTEGNWLLYAEGGFDRTAKAGPQRDLCTGAANGATVCRPVTWGGPGTATAGRAAVGARHAFTAEFGVAPRFSWDFGNDRGAFELPLYLLARQSGGLTGGVSVGVETEAGTPFLRVFVGELLSLRP